MNKHASPEHSNTNSGQTASTVVAATLRKTILDGAHHPGDRLPTERELAEQYQVSRHVVREALKRLEATGLVQIRHGSGCYITNLQFTGGMELLEDMLLSDGQIDIALVEDIVDFVSNMGRAAIQRAAAHRNDSHVEQLRQVFDEHSRNIADIEKTSETSFQIFQILADATGNRVYRLAFNSVGRVFSRIRRQIPIPLTDMSNDIHLQRMLEAIEEQDPELAVLYYDRELILIRKVLNQYLALLATPHKANPNPTA